MGAKQQMICPKCVRYIYKDYDEKYWYCPHCNEHYSEEDKPKRKDSCKNWW